MIRRHRLVVRTSGFHPENRGSIPRGGAKIIKKYIMPNKKSAKKALRQSKKRALYNKKIKTEIKKLMKKTFKAILAKKKEAEEIGLLTIKKIDKAVQKGVLKKNTGARKKSKIRKKLNEFLAKAKDQSQAK